MLAKENRLPAPLPTFSRAGGSNTIVLQDAEGEAAFSRPHYEPALLATLNERLKSAARSILLSIANGLPITQGQEAWLNLDHKSLVLLPGCCSGQQSNVGLRISLDASMGTGPGGDNMLRRELFNSNTLSLLEPVAYPFKLVRLVSRRLSVNKCELCSAGPKRVSTYLWWRRAAATSSDRLLPPRLRDAHRRRAWMPETSV